MLGWAPPDAIEPGPPRFVVFDVGLGDAMLVEGREAAMLVDAGWAAPDSADIGRSVVLPALRALGISRLDVVVATHADLDHRGGLPAVLRAMPVGEVWLPPGPYEDFAELREAARRAGVPVRVRHRQQQPISLGDLDVDLLWPPPDGDGPASRQPARSRNDGSLVLGVQVAGTRLLLTGDIGTDAEDALLRAGSELRAHVLKVAHHGSRGSSSDAFLAAVGADVALISAPCSRHARLPTREALERLDRAGASVGWTGRDGALFVRLDKRVRAFEGWRRDPGCQAP